MEISKRGLFFTGISIFLAFVIITSATLTIEHRLKEKMYTVEERVMSMNCFIDDIERDAERALYISGFRSMLGLGERMAKNGSFFEDTDEVFTEAILYGEIEGEKLNITENATFLDWAGRATNIGGSINIDVNMSDFEIELFQDNPWTVKIGANFTLKLKDMMKLAEWTRQESITTEISILEFEDPLYTIKTGGLYLNKIIKSNVTDFVDGEDASGLILHANNSWYKASITAPSYLMRLKGETGASPYGIESIVNIQELGILFPSLVDSSKSVIDYIYFGNQSVSICSINETRTELTWLKLDDDVEPFNHLDDYEVNCES